jgi:hypothetical protein
MREIVFHVQPRSALGLEAVEPERQLKIAAPSLEELHEEARDALIQHFGAAHLSYRVRLRHLQPRKPLPRSLVTNAMLAPRH